MQPKDTEDLLRLIARLYYVDRLGQDNIAQFVKISQAKVSRLLVLARERGIVSISVQDYDPRRLDLEKKLLKTLCLADTAVIKTAPGTTVEEARRAVGYFGASFVNQLVQADGTVAIAGGRTMCEVVRMLPRGDKENLVIVQAMGNISATVGPLDALELARAMAQHWKGRFMTIPTPAFVPDKKTRDAFLALPQIDTVWQRFEQVNIAMVGIGTLENSIFSEHGMLTPGDVKQLRACGVVGEIFGRFFDHHGRECATSWKDRVMSMELSRLRLVPQVIGIVAGADRAAALLAAIRGGLLKSLVIDEEGALALLAKARTRPSKNTR